MIYYEEYGSRNNPTIVFLHGANLVQSFFKQYCFSDRYNLIVPHITGYGKEAGTVYTTEKAMADITELIKSLDRKVILTGFSLGAQLAVKLVSEHEELFYGFIAVSPWIIKERDFLEKVVKQNDKAFKMMKFKPMIRLSGKMMGLDKKNTDELVEYYLSVQKQTILNSVDNGIELDKMPEFFNVKIPVLALCGEKEYPEVHQSVKKMAENPNCSYEIWEKAAHNIPTAFSEKFNKKIDEFLKNMDFS